MGDHQEIGKTRRSHDTTCHSTLSGQPFEVHSWSALRRHLPYGNAFEGLNKSHCEKTLDAADSRWLVFEVKGTQRHTPIKLQDECTVGSRNIRLVLKHRNSRNSMEL